MSKLIIFDWGGVLNHLTIPDKLGHVYHDFLDRIGYILHDNESSLDVMKKSATKSWAVINSPTCINTRFTNILEYCKLPVTDDSIRRAKWCYYAAFIESGTRVPLLKYISSLPSVVKRGLFSNLTKFDGGILYQQLSPILFDYYWLSYEVGLTKPDIDFCRGVMKDAGVKGSDILYFDDSEKNLHPAQECGWITVLIPDMSDVYITALVKDAIDKFLQT